MSELWRAVEGYEGIFEVSNLGRVRSLSLPSNPEIGQYCRQGRVLKPFYTTDGYLRVSLNYLGEARKFPVHQLVAIAFKLPKGEEATQINHKDTVKDNNCVDNLEWVTGLENMQHCIDMKILHPLHNPNARKKLEPEDVECIRKSYAAGDVTQWDLAIQFSVRQSTVSKIVRNKNWTI